MAPLPRRAWAWLGMGARCATRLSSAKSWHAKHILKLVLIRNKMAFQQPLHPGRGLKRRARRSGDINLYAEAPERRRWRAPRLVFYGPFSGAGGGPREAGEEMNQTRLSAEVKEGRSCAPGARL